MQIKLGRAEETRRLGLSFARCIKDACFIALSGPLGAGKTTFAQGLGEGLGITEAITSPTFTTLNEYPHGRLPLYHLDLYRIGESCEEGATAACSVDLEMLESELDELLEAPGVVLIEWPEFFESYISNQDHVIVQLDYLRSTDASGPEAGRVASLSARGPASQQIVEMVANVYFS